MLKVRVVVAEEVSNPLRIAVVGVEVAGAVMGSPTESTPRTISLLTTTTPTHEVVVVDGVAAVRPTRINVTMILGGRGLKVSARANTLSRRNATEMRTTMTLRRLLIIGRRPSLLIPRRWQCRVLQARAVARITLARARESTRTWEQLQSTSRVMSTDCKLKRKSSLSVKVEIETPRIRPRLSTTTRTS